MGNLTISQLPTRDEDEDAEFLSLSLQAFFNDSFVATKADDVPEYGFVSTNPDVDATKTKAVVSEFDDELRKRWEKLIPIFLPKVDKLEKVEDVRVFQTQQRARYEQTAFAAMALKRKRIMLRIFEATWPRLKKVVERKLSQGSAQRVGNQWRLPKALETNSVTTAQDGMFSMIMSMTLSLAKSMGRTNAGILLAVLTSLVETLSALPPLSLATTYQSQLGRSTLQSILSLCADIDANPTAAPELRSIALSLKLTLSLLTGSVGLASGIAYLLTANSDLTVHEGVQHLLKSCLSLAPKYGVSFPTLKNIMDTNSASFNFAEEEIHRFDSIYQNFSLACDGVYLYVFDGVHKQLTKYGTGYHGTIPAEMMGSLKLEEISALRCDASTVEWSGKIAVLDGHLYLRLSFLGSDEMLMIDANTLLFERVIDFSASRHMWLEQPKFQAKEIHCTKDVCIEVSATQSIYLAAGMNAKMKLLRAVSSTDVDLTHVFEEFMENKNENSLSMCVPDLAKVIAQHFPTVQPNETLTFTFEITGTTMNVHTIALPMTSDGRSLISLLECKLGTFDGDNVGFLDVQPNKLALTSVNSTLEVKGQIESINHFFITQLCSYLRFVHEHGLDADYSSQSKQDWADVLQLALQLDADQLGWFMDNAHSITFNFNYRSQGNISLTFKTAMDWAQIFEATRMACLNTQIRYDAVVFYPHSSGNFEFEHIPLQLEENTENGLSLKLADLLYDGYTLTVLSAQYLLHDPRVRVSGLRSSVGRACAVLEEAQFTFNNKSELPVAFTFDSANNLSWAVDIIGNQIFRWRNAYPCATVVPNPNRAVEGLLTWDAAGRIERYVNELTGDEGSGEVLGAVTITLLEKLSEPYGSSYKSFSQDDPVNQVKLSARSGTAETTRSTISVGGIQVHFGEHDSVLGYHVAVLDEDFKIMSKRSFLLNDQRDTGRLADFLDQLDFGVYVLVACCSVHQGMNYETYEALKKVGACDLESRMDAKSLILIGRKGLQPGQADFMLGKEGELLSLTRVLPGKSVPLAVDASSQTVVELVDLSLAWFQRIVAEPSNENKLAPFCSMLRVLQVHLHQFITFQGSGKLASLLQPSTAAAMRTMLSKLFNEHVQKFPYLKEAVSSIYATTFDTLYAASDRKGLVKHFAKVLDGKLCNTSDLLQLEVLLIRYTDSHSLISVNTSSGKLNFEFALDMLNLCMNIIRWHFRATFDDTDDSEASLEATKVFKQSVSVLQEGCKLLMVTNAAKIVENFQECESETLHVILEVALNLSRLSRDLVDVAVGCASSSNCNEAGIWKALEGLRSSPLGSVYLTAVMTVDCLISRYGYAFLSRTMDVTLDLIQQMGECHQMISSLLRFVPEKARVYDDVLPKPSTVVKIYESEHPYRSNMNETTVVRLPGAKSVTIAFDRASRTEHECDYVIFQDLKGNALHPGRFTGRDGNQNWPGCDNRPPLTLDVSEFQFFFRSDGSVEDWGYKFSVTANYPMKQQVQDRAAWLLRLEFQLVSSLSVIGTALVKGPPRQHESEAKYLCWMENSLIKPELFLFKEYGGGEENDFLLDLIERRSGSDAERFARIMKGRVPEDQGSIDAINRAVYATCAAIIKANNLTAEALAIARMKRLDVSSQLLKAWKAGQKMRSYFDLKDLRDAQMPTAKEDRRPSVYAGADAGVIEAASAEVVERAKFLLRTPVSADHTIHEGEVSEKEADDAVIPSNLSPGKTTITPYQLPTSSSGKDLSPNRWRLAAEAATLQRQFSDETKNTAKMWQSLVGEAVVVDKLKNLLMHRRKFAERSRASKQLTMTEKVLQFVQSDVNIDKLQEMNGMRNKRAIARSKGFDVFSQLINGNAPAFAAYISTSLLLDALNSTKRDEGQGSGVLHYCNGVEGCSPEQNMLLWQKYCAILRCCAEVMKQYAEGCSEASQHYISMLSSCLALAALDYEVADQSMVLESGILESLAACINRKELDVEVKEKVVALIEVLVSRFVVFESAEAAESNQVMKRLLQLAVAALDQNVVDANDEDKSPLLQRLSSEESSTVISIDGVIELKRAGSTSYAISHKSLPLDHTIYFRMKRVASEVLDGQEKIDSDNVVGRFVTRGLTWNEVATPDAGVGSIGVVTKVNKANNTLSVLWPHNREFSYPVKFHDLPSSLADDSTLSLADPGAGGYLFSVGSKNLVKQVQDNSRNLPYLEHISVQLLPDCTLFVLYQFSDNKVFALRCKDRIAPEAWVHVAITCDAAYHFNVFLNGSLCASEMLSGFESHSLESDHPLQPSMEFNKSCSLADVENVVLWFDAKTEMPENMQIAVHEGTTNNQYLIWSNENSTSLPGVSGMPAIRTNYSTIVLRGTVPDELDGEKGGIYLRAKGMTGKDLLHAQSMVPPLPFYFGVPPSFVVNDSALMLQSMTGLVADFKVSAGAFWPKRIQDLCSTEWKLGKEKFVDEELVMSVFGILRKSLNDQDLLTDSSFNRSLVNHGVLKVLMTSMQSESSTIQCGAYQLAAQILPNLDPVLVQTYANSTGLVEDGAMFMQHVFTSLGSFINYWANRLERVSTTSVNAISQLYINRSAVFVAQLQLLRALCANKEWMTQMKEYLSQLLSHAEDIIIELVGVATKELSMEVYDVSSFWTKTPVDRISQLNGLFSLFSFLGYSISGIYPGANVFYRETGSAVDELATVLALAPGPFHLAEMKKINPSLVKKWDSCSEGVVIALSTQPGESMLVPITSLRVASDTVADNAKTWQMFGSMVDIDKMAKLYAALLELPNIDPRPRPQSTNAKREKVLVYESEHPYPDDVDVLDEISVAGAEELHISFSDKSQLETNCDYIAFYKNSNRKDLIGVIYTGCNGAENFPGSGGRPALVVPGSSVFYHFHSDTTNNGWGYCFTVRALISSNVEPPYLPPVPCFSALMQLKMVALKSLKTMVSELPDVAVTTLSTSFGHLLRSALSPRPNTSVYARDDAGKKEVKLVFESTHPYADGLNVYTPVSVPGAISYLITFDSQTRTEGGCDYIQFQDDEVRRERLEGTENYTGGKDGSTSNWPGLGGRPPLEINRDSFVIYFHSDGSVNDWGYCMYVTATVKGASTDGVTKKIRGENMSGPEAENSFWKLQSLALEGTDYARKETYATLQSFEQLPPPNRIRLEVHVEDIFGSDHVCAEESKEELTVDEEKTDDEAGSLLKRLASIHIDAPTKYLQMVVSTEVDVRQSPDAEAAVIRRAQVGEKYVILNQQGDWMSVRALNENESTEGEQWVLFRSADTFYLQEQVDDVFAQFIKSSAGAKQTETVKAKQPVSQNALYSTSDKSTVSDRDVSGIETSILSTSSVLQDIDFIDAAIGEYLTIAVIEYASQCVEAFVENWPVTSPCTSAQFGGLDNFLTYVNCICSKKVDDPLAPAPLKKLLNMLVKRSAEGDCSLLLEATEFAVSYLRCMTEGKVKTESNHAIAGTMVKGKRKVLESKHPYNDYLDEDYRCEFPGAKRIEIEFDPSSATETNCDYLIIYDRSKNRQLYGSKIHGFKDSSERHWPGVNVPKVVITGEEEFVINFRSDSSRTDWGFKATATAIMEEKEVGKKTTENNEIATTCCKLVIALLYDLIIRGDGLVAAVRSQLFTLENLRGFVKFFGEQGDSAEYRDMLLNIFVIFVREWGKGRFSNWMDFMDDFRQLERKLVCLAHEHYMSETEKGKNLAAVSPFLQSLVQLLVSINNHFFTLQLSVDCRDVANAKAVGVFPDVEANGLLQTVFAMPSRAGELISTWNVAIESCQSGQISIGLAAAVTTAAKRYAGVGSNAGILEIGWQQHQVLALAGLHQVPYGTKAKVWSTGDTISVTYDRQKGYVRFSINGAELDKLALGPGYLLPVMEADVVDGSFVLAVSFVPDKDTIKVTYGEESGAANLDVSKGPLEWLTPLYNLFDYLAAVQHQQLPSYIFMNKFLPYCNKKSAVEIEKPEVTQSFETEVVVAGAVSLNFGITAIKLLDGDLLEVVDEAGKVLYSLIGPYEAMNADISVDDVAIQAAAFSMKGAKDRLSRIFPDTSKDDARVGGYVRRGPDWRHGSQDGGVGGIGKIEKVSSWKGEEKACLVVRWLATKTQHEYCFGYNGIREVAVLSAGEMEVLSLPPSTGLIIGLPPVVTLRVLLQDGSGEGRLIKCGFTPSMSVHYCVNNPSFEAYYRRLCSLYIPRSRTALGALVKHVDSVVERKSISVADLMAGKWDLFKPTPEDLTRSVALKELHNATAQEISQVDLETIEALENPSSRAKTSVAMPTKKFSDPYENQTTAGDYANWCGISDFASFEEALAAALEVFPECLSIVKEENGSFTLRNSKTLQPRNGCTAWLVTPVLAQGADESDWQTIDQSSDTVSRFNSDYYCEVLQVSIKANEARGTILRVNFHVRGDQSLGELQPPQSSELQDGDGNRYNSDSATIELRDPFQIKGYLVFVLPNDPQLLTRPLLFTYGSSGYRPATLQTTAPAAPSQPNIPRCTNNHAMVISDYREGGYRTGWICNKCRCHGTGLRWLCVGCQDDYCFRCDPIQPMHPVCGAGHRMPRSTSNPAEYRGIARCDVCRRSNLPNDPEFYHCQTCGYDLCLRCTTEQINRGGVDPNSIHVDMSDEESEEEHSTEFDSEGDEGEEYDSSDDESIHGNHRRERRANESSGTGLPVCEKCSNPVHLHPAGTWGDGWSCDWHEHTGRNSFTRHDGVYGCDTILRCNWGICQTCWGRIEGRMKATENVAKRLLSGDLKPIVAQFSLVVLINAALTKSLSFIDLRCRELLPDTLSALVSDNRDLFFHRVKEDFFSNVLQRTAGSGGMFDLPLNRLRARRLFNSGKTDTDGRWSVFAQAMRVMHAMSPSSLRRSDRLYNTQFMGEHSQDAGGPYRESFDIYAQELQSTALPLLLRTQNGRQAVGYNREKFVFNPSATSTVCLEMYAFLGKLMGIAIRSKEFLALNLPSLIWKLIAGDRPTVDDLEGIDFSLVKSLDALRTIEQKGVDAESFSSVFLECFTTHTSDDREVELVPGGRTRELTFDSRFEYCEKVLAYRLHEFDVQAAAVRRGLATIVPIACLTMYRWDELEEMVCGRAEIDVELLKSMTEYSGCSATDAHIALFWQAVQEFTTEERSALIRFTWGRSRLPLTAAGFNQRFKLQNFEKHPADAYFPVAHTCFFSLELPRYTTLAIMKEKLRYAIFNCEAIDGDDTATSMAVAAMGWEEEEEV